MTLGVQAAVQMGPLFRPSLLFSERATKPRKKTVTRCWSREQIIRPQFEGVVWQFWEFHGVICSVFWGAYGGMFGRLARACFSPLDWKMQIRDPLYQVFLV